MASDNILTEWFVLHSLKGSSTRPGSGPFPSCLEASPAIFKMLLYVGLTVWGFVSPMSPGTV